MVSKINFQGQSVWNIFAQCKFISVINISSKVRYIIQGVSLRLKILGSLKNPNQDLLVMDMTTQKYTIGGAW